MHVTSDDPTPVFDDTVIPLQGTETEVFEPTPSTTLDYVLDVYHGTAPVSAPLPVGTRFLFTLTPGDSSGDEYVTVTLGGSTTETVAIVAPTGHSLADAELGGTLTVQWKAPKTFAVRSIELWGECWAFGGTQRASIDSDETSKNSVPDASPLMAKSAVFRTNCRVGSGLRRTYGTSRSGWLRSGVALG